MDIAFSFDFQPVSKHLRDKVFQRDKFKCVYCGNEASTIDHVVPIERGGHNLQQNLVAACRSCNSSKGNRLLEEWKPDEWEICTDINCTMEHLIRRGIDA